MEVLRWRASAGSLAAGLYGLVGRWADIKDAYPSWLPGLEYLCY